MTAPAKKKRPNPFRRNRTIDAQNAKRVRIYLKGFDEPSQQDTSAIIAKAIAANRITHCPASKRTRSDRVG